MKGRIDTEVLLAFDGGYNARTRLEIIEQWHEEIGGAWNVFFGEGVNLDGDSMAADLSPALRPARMVPTSPSRGGA